MNNVPNDIILDFNPLVIKNLIFIIKIFYSIIKSHSPVKIDEEEDQVVAHTND